MDQTLCRKHLEDLIGRETAALQHLEVLLGREQETINANDVSALERAGAARQECMGELMHIEEERRSLCRMLDYSADAPGLDRLLAWCDPSRAIAKQWQICLDFAKRCRDLNEVNGALVGARLKRVEKLLAVVTGQTHEKKVYGRGVMKNAYGISGSQLSLTA